MQNNEQSSIEHALILIDKPSGITSYDCIRLLKQTLKRTDLGHGGTLDCFASGLLPVFLGEGLKLVRFLLDPYPNLPTYWKTYEGTIELGRSTTTGDPEGETVEIKPVPQFNDEQIKSIVHKFISEPYIQTPPAYSAKKIAGQRAADLIRQGITPHLKSTQVFIKNLNILNISNNCIQFSIQCSKGTYVRVFAQDFALQLGTVGFLNQLRRTAVGTWNVSKAVSLDAIKQGLNIPIQNLSEVVEFLPAFPIQDFEMSLVAKGKLNSVTTRLANSGLTPNAYCAQSAEKIPVALFELEKNHRAKFLRSFDLLH